MAVVHDLEAHGFSQGERHAQLKAYAWELLEYRGLSLGEAHEHLENVIKIPGTSVNLTGPRASATVRSMHAYLDTRAKHVRPGQARRGSIPSLSTLLTLLLCGLNPGKRTKRQSFPLKLKRKLGGAVPPAWVANVHDLWLRERVRWVLGVFIATLGSTDTTHEVTITRATMKQIVGSNAPPTLKGAAYKLAFGELQRLGFVEMVGGYKKGEHGCVFKVYLGNGGLFTLGVTRAEYVDTSPVRFLLLA